MSSRPIEFRASSARPCPVCGTGTKSCSATDDGLYLCRGAPLPGWPEVSKSPDDAGFRHYRRPDERRDAPPRGKPARVPEWPALAGRRAEELARRPHDLEALADDLKLPREVFGRYAVGLRVFPNGDRQFTIPERDGAGTVVGLATRVYRDGRPVEKKRVTGSKCGLTIPAGWRDRPGPLFCVEGFTDAAAMTAAGLCAVGRPNNAGGAQHLAELLRDWPAHRGVVVVGENDRKPGGDWPGKAGADSVARKLRGSLSRAVLSVLPPVGVKDVREWLTAPAIDSTPWAERGATLAALLDGSPTVYEPPGGSAAEPRPTIVISTEEHAVNDQATAALAQDGGVYQRGGMLVHVLRQQSEAPPDATVRRPVGAPIVRELPRPLLRERLSRCVEWKAFRGSGEKAEYHPAHPPEWCVTAVHARGAWPEVRYLEAVLTHPVLLPDGSILGANGYHAPSRLLGCMPADLTVHVRERPTRADATAAVKVLLEPLADFPFETPAHRSALIAGLLTPLAWFSFDGPAPMFLIDKNVRGAGAGLLADVVSLVVAGRRFPVMGYTNDREELRKRITTLAIEGERMVLLDNLAGPVGNDILDAALTADAWKDRVLGSNKGYDGPLHVVWFGTGNNVQLGADTSRRVCHVRMESLDERPELRSGFRYPNLREHVRRDRGRLLSAALTILRAFVVAGKPCQGLPPWGSYEGWSAVVRDAVAFAGLPDPGETRAQLQTVADRDAVAMSDILDGLERMAAGGRGVTTSEIVRRLKESGPNEWVDAMRAGVEDLCGRLDSRLLGFKFRRFKRRNFGGRMLDGAKGGQGTSRWEVVTANGRSHPGDVHHPHHDHPEPNRPGGDGGDGGHVPAEPRGPTSRHAGKLFEDYADQMPPD